MERLVGRKKELMEILAEHIERSKQYIERDRQAMIRVAESRDRQKHNRRLISELKVDLYGKDKDKTKQRQRKILIVPPMEKRQNLGMSC